jgi:hypothetical protein
LPDLASSTAAHLLCRRLPCLPATRGPLGRVSPRPAGQPPQGKPPVSGLMESASAGSTIEFSAIDQLILIDNVVVLTILLQSSRSKGQGRGGCGFWASATAVVDPIPNGPIPGVVRRWKKEGINQVKLASKVPRRHAV